MQNKGRDLRIAYEKDLIVDRDFAIQKSLDRHVASVTVDTRDNFLNDGYDIELSASFGREAIKLISEGFEVEVDISVRKAEIDLSFDRTRYTRIFDGNSKTNAEWRLSETETYQEGADNKIGGKFGASINETGPEAELGINANVEFTAAKKRKTEAHRTRLNWHFIGKNAIAIGGTRDALEGREVDALKAWRGFPVDTTTPSGVIAKLKVRENWLNFDNPEYKYNNNVIGQKVKELITSKKEERKKLFDLLLKNLVYRQLPKSEDGREAIIAVDALIVRPGEENAHGVVNGQGSGRINLPSQPIIEYLQSPEGDEIHTLIELGVSKEEVISAAGHDQSDLPNSKFVPQSPPEIVFSAFKRILELVRANREIKREELLAEFGRNTIRDIWGLQIIQGEGSDIEICFDRFADPEVTFKYLATSAVSLRVARRSIMQNSSISGVEVADIVCEALGRNWERSSKQRYGAELKRWAIWLEPHIVDPSKNAHAYSLLAFAKGDKPKHGRRRSVVTNELRERILSMSREGMSRRQISETLRMTNYTIRKALDGVTDPQVSKSRKVTPEIVQKIRTLRSEGLTQKKIAEIVGLSQPTVGKVLREKN